VASLAAVASIISLASAQASVVALAALTACGGQSGGGGAATAPGRDGAAGDDAGSDAAQAAATPEGAAAPYSLAPLDEDGRVRDGGRVTVHVRWSDAPAALRAPRDRNACGERRPGAVQIHTLGGVRDAVVGLGGVTRGVAPPAPAPVDIGVRRCRPRPRVQVAPRLGVDAVLHNADERRHDVTIRALAAEKSFKTTEKSQSARPNAENNSINSNIYQYTESPPMRFSLPLVGQAVAIPLAEPQMIEIAVAADPDPAYVVAPAHPYVRLTDGKGDARLEQVPPGAYSVWVWHPPTTPGGAPVTAAGEVSVQPGGAVEVTLNLSETRTPGEAAQ
jgi:hypothetical protein